MCDPLAVDIFTDKNKKILHQLICLLFLFASWVHVFFMSYLRCSGVRDSPSASLSTPPPALCFRQPRKGKQKAHQNSILPNGEKKPVVLTTTLNMLQF